MAIHVAAGWSVGIDSSDVSGRQIGQFALNTVTSIVIDASGGNDSVTLINIAIDSEIYGGNGNDTLIGSLGNDSIFGEAGNDSLFGR